MKTLIGKVTDELEEKRFYFKGKIKVKCPNCKTQMVRDFEDDYLSYPQIGEMDELSYCCEKCDKEWVMPFKVKSVDVILEYDDEKITEYK
jgi:C4-type Zn-finger protein